MMAALGSSKKDFTKEEQNKTFMQLLLMSVVGLLVIAVVSGLTYNFIASLIY